MKTTAAMPAVTIATLSLAWSIGTALPATAETRTDMSQTAPSEGALSSVPRPYLTWYQRAARTCPGLGWPVLAGVGEVESDHGQSPLPGVHNAANFAGAEGPMQFEPRTFAAYAVKADPRHALSVYDPEDAIFTAARMLCDDGAAGGTPQGIDTALYAYNHADWYPREVLSWAARYAGATSTVVFRRSVPAPPGHGHAGHHQDRPQPVRHTSHTHPAHQVSAVAATTRGDHPESAEMPSIGAEALQLAAEAGQLASEAHLLSGEAQQLTTEARQLSGEAHQPPSAAQQPAPSTAEPAQPPTATPPTPTPATTTPADTTLAPATLPAPTATPPAPARTPPPAISTAPVSIAPPTPDSAPPAEPASAPPAPVPSAPTAESGATSPSAAIPAASAVNGPTAITPATAAPAAAVPAASSSASGTAAEPGPTNKQQPPRAQQPKPTDEPAQVERTATN